MPASTNKWLEDDLCICLSSYFFFSTHICCTAIKERPAVSQDMVDNTDYIAVTLCNGIIHCCCTLLQSCMWQLCRGSVMFGGCWVSPPLTANWQTSTYLLYLENLWTGCTDGKIKDTQLYKSNIIYSIFLWWTQIWSLVNLQIWKDKC